MNSDRIAAVADALAAIGYDGIAVFDRIEPEYATLETLLDRFDADDNVMLLATLAAT